MKILVDSDILIEVSRAKHQEILFQWIELSESGITVLYTPVSEAELWEGVKPGEQRALAHLFRTLKCAPIDCEIGRRAGHYLLQYRKSHGMELGDALIAATAHAHSAHLWTRNHRHFPMKDLEFY